MDHTKLRIEHIIYARECLAPFLTLLFNYALAEGIRPYWTMNIVAPIHREDAMDLYTYTSIMIGHMLVKLYGAMMRQNSSRLNVTKCSLVKLR